MVRPITPRCRVDLPRPRGFMMLMGLLSMTVLVGFVALAVDFGHVQVARYELQACCDAAARAGAQTLGTPQVTTAAQVTFATNAAVAIASQNVIDNQPLLLLTSGMVLVGNYDLTKSPTFSVARLPLNSVQVTAYRDQAHGDPIPLALASAVGVTSIDINSTATACNAPQPSTYGLAGVSHASFASLGALACIEGNFVSNGNVSVGAPLGIGVSVTGDVRSSAGAVSKGSVAAIGGTTAALPTALTYPSVVVPTRYDNSAIAANLDASSNFSATVIADIPGGTYVVHDLNLLAGLVVNLDGPVTFYVTGSLNMAATVNLCNVLNTTPNNFNIMVAPGGNVNFVGDLLSPVAMNVYAPDSGITMAVTVNHFTGSLIGKSLDISIPVISRFTEKPPYASVLQTSLVK